eukprot:Gb_29927 [translate_table: standard]
MVLNRLGHAGTVQDFPLQLWLVESHKLVDLFPIFYENKSWHCSNVPFFDHIRQFINIHLEEHQLWVLLRKLSIEWCNHFARTTPCCCKVHHNSLSIRRCLKNFSLPLLLGGDNMYISMRASHLLNSRNFTVLSLDQLNLTTNSSPSLLLLLSTAVCRCLVCRCLDRCI